MALKLGQLAPDFEQDSTQGPIRFHAWLGRSWGVLFSHARAFSPVCTTELGEVARLHGEWARRNVKVIALSVDPVEAHLKWEADIQATQGERPRFPILGDSNRSVALLYGMIHERTISPATARCVFVIDPAKKVRLIQIYPPSTGRSCAELLRAIDSLQLADAQSVVTPADWRPGQQVLISPRLSDEEAARVFPQGYEARSRYLRLVDLDKASS